MLYLFSSLEFAPPSPDSFCSLSYPDIANETICPQYPVQLTRYCNAASVRSFSPVDMQILTSRTVQADTGTRASGHCAGQAVLVNLNRTFFSLHVGGLRRNRL